MSTQKIPGPKTLNELLDGLFPEERQSVKAQAGESLLPLQVSNVTSDSRRAGPGTLFVAVRGENRDGHELIAQVQKAGAVAVLAERVPSACAPVLLVKDSRLALARLAAAFHGNPSRGMLAIGVTGTSGKTTVTYILESILAAAGRKPGVIGTVNFRFGSKIYPSTHTTPGAEDLQGLLAEMKADGCDSVVMEISSHALKQRRTAGLALDAMVFNNLTPEHLDYHPDMEDYFASKRLLFTEYAKESWNAGKRPLLVINIDDPYGRRLLLELPRALEEKSYSVLTFGSGAGPDYEGAGLVLGASGIHGVERGVRIDSGLFGAFNRSNLLAAIAAADGLGLSRTAIAGGIRNLPNVPGRLERVENRLGFTVLVDYAHKPDALEKVLKSLREVRGKGQLITVFGCGGDRDRTKRSVMGRLAAELSDRALITSDNPRTEDPAAIISEIVRGASGCVNFQVEPDRRKAISLAIRSARSGDLVLIAGKGHEDYQILGTEKVHFDDREEALAVIRELECKTAGS